MLKKQRIISKIIIGTVLVCVLIIPVLAVNFAANILPEELQIVSTDPSIFLNLQVDESQSFMLTLNHPATTIWYTNGTESYTTLNLATSTYYFTACDAGIINITAISNDSLSEVTYTWFVTVCDPSQPYEETHAPLYKPYIRPLIEITDEVWVDYPEEVEEPEKEGILNDTEKVVIGLCILFSLLFLFTLQRGGETMFSPKHGPPHR